MTPLSAAPGNGSTTSLSTCVTTPALGSKISLSDEPDAPTTRRLSSPSTPRGDSSRFGLINLDALEDRVKSRQLKRLELYSRACTYEAAHTRVREARGRASQWRCIRCGAVAAQWAYRGASPREISGVREYTRDGRRRRVELRWSPDPADYDPLCATCHGQQTRDDHGHGYRHDPAARAAYLERQREYHARRRAEIMADPDRHAAYRERQRANHVARRRAQTTQHEGDPT